MTTARRTVRVPREGPLNAEQGIELFLRSLKRKKPWYPALLEVIARWTDSDEMVDDDLYQYLLLGEAFDWLRLAQRLLEAAGSLVPSDEAERLLFFSVAPDGQDEEAFAQAIGPQKHRAHLNFVYGVVVEETLLLSAESELQKAGSNSGARNGESVEAAAYQRIYGVAFEELATIFRTETGLALGERSSVTELCAFTYWCSKYRLRTTEPARVASDTRKAMALLSQMERGRRRLGARPGAIDARTAAAPKRRRRKTGAAVRARS